MNNKLMSSNFLDKFAMVLSGVCIVHCLFTPVAITLLPIIAFNSIPDDALFHQLMLWLALPSSGIALFLSCRKHRDLTIVATGVLGMLILILGVFIGHELLTPAQEKIMASMGGLVLASSHILNYRACQKQPCDDDQCASKHHH